MATLGHHSGLLIIFPYPAVSHVFQGPGSSGARFFRVRVQVPGLRSKVQGPGAGFRSGWFCSNKQTKFTFTCNRNDEDNEA